MPFLVDANTVSELRKKVPNPGVIRWFGGLGAQQVYLSVLTIGELRRGIERLRRRDSDQAATLDEWLAGLVGMHATRTVGVDLEVADYWARLDARLQLPAVDGLLAATALVRGWTIVTRNVSDFERTGVSLLNPFT